MRRRCSTAGKLDPQRVWAGELDALRRRVPAQIERVAGAISFDFVMRGKAGHRRHRLRMWLK
jgi:hypothetical protein